MKIEFRPCKANHLFPVLAFVTEEDRTWNMYFGWLNLIWRVYYNSKGIK